MRFTQVKTLHHNTEGNDTTTGTAYSACTEAPIYFLYESGDYDGTIEIYFEAVLKSSNASGTAYAALYDTDGTKITEVSTSSTSFSRQRSGAVSLTDGKTYCVYMKSSNASYTATIGDVRILIIQSGTVTKTCSRYTLAGRGSHNNTTYGDARTHYFTYTASDWDGTTSFYFEASAYNGAAGGGYVALYDSSNNTIAEFNFTTANRQRSTLLTLTNGETYRVVVKSTSASYWTIMCEAAFVIKQTGSPTKVVTTVPAGTYRSGTATTYTSENTVGHVFYWDETDWDTDSKTVTHVARMRSTNAGATAYLDFQGGGEVSTTSTVTVTQTSSSFSPSDHTDCSPRYKITSASYNVRRNYAHILVKLVLPAAAGGHPTVARFDRVPFMAFPGRCFRY